MIFATMGYIHDTCTALLNTLYHLFYVNRSIDVEYGPQSNLQRIKVQLS